MNGLMIGLGLAGVFAGAAVGLVRELTHDWNGGTTKKGAGQRFFRATAGGAILGMATGWVFSDTPVPPDQQAFEACLRNAPSNVTVVVGRDERGAFKCSYQP